MKSIVKGFSNVFENCSLWTAAGYEWMLVGIKDGGMPANEKHFRSQWQDPIVGPEMRALGFPEPEQLGSLFIADGARLRKWIKGTLPLIDNYPRRLSANIPNQNTDIPVYRDFMDPSSARDNFMSSDYIRKMWPENIIAETDKYFQTRPTLDKLFTIKMKNYQVATGALHDCIHNPLLKSYIPWTLNSDRYAQNIVERVRAKGSGPIRNPLMVPHVAATAIQDRDFKLVERYLKALTDIIEKKALDGAILHPETANTFHLLIHYRIYLLYISGDSESARGLANGYLNAQTSDEGKKQIETFWKWVVQTAKSNDILMKPEIKRN